eukprot:3027478-Prymnesium_polylepis.1
MCFAPSFLRSPGGAVTRISESKRSRSDTAIQHDTAIQMYHHPSVLENGLELREQTSATHSAHHVVCAAE